MRKLATLVKISEVLPIKNADRLEVAKMEGKAWQVVVGKGDFAVDDCAVYFEIDSFLPKKEPYLFLEGRCNKKMNGEDGYRLRTIKLRGVVSQGLLMPLSKFSKELYPEFDKYNGDGFASIGDNIGDDVTDLLGVQLYEPPVPAQLAGNAKGGFPSFISKTDQPRIQNLLTYFDTMKGVAFEATTKMDGSSMTAYYSVDCEDAFGVCSRNMNLKEKDTNTFWKVARHNMLEEKLEALYIVYKRNIAIQGELVGEGIQKNRSKIKGHDIFIFDIFDIDKYTYVSPNERLRLLTLLDLDFNKQLNHVPIINPKMKVFDEFTNFEELHDWVSSQRGYNDTTIEGVVFKSCEPIDGQIVSFKVINNKYLLKHGE